MNFYVVHRDNHAHKLFWHKSTSAEILQIIAFGCTLYGKIHYEQKKCNHENTSYSS